MIPVHPMMKTTQLFECAANCNDWSKSTKLVIDSEPLNDSRAPNDEDHSIIWMRRKLQWLI